MTKKLLLGAAACVAVLAGARLEFGADDAPRAPFISPLASLNAICGEGGELAARRAFFIRAAAAYAAAEEAGASAPARTASGIHYAVTTANEEAQAHFDAGVAQMWNFNHAAAVAAFKAAQAADPDCAMCFWGEAFALGPNINAPMDAEADKPAYEALEKALACATKQARAKPR